VLIVTRADRDVSSAALVVNGVSVPLRVKGRELTGSFVVDAPGTSHVAFLEGSRVVAEGPDMPVVAEPDTAPQVRISAPLDELELDPEARAVTVKYDAVDDFGLSALALVYRADGHQEQRVPLKPDEGRATRGQYAWSLSALSLRPGATVQYFIEATDNDAVKGPKKAVSRTQRLTLYSAAAHRRDALKKAEALWERLVTHLADRLESRERTALTAEVAQQHRSTDGAAMMLGSDLAAFAKSLASEREPPEGLLGAAANIATELNRDLSETSLNRLVYLRVAGRDPEHTSQRPAPAETVRIVGQRLVESLRRDAEHSEKNVLYLESLLDRAKLQAMKDLAQELQRERRELSRLLEEFRSTKDDATKQALLERMSALKERMAELQARMSELAKGIRDDFMNREAIDEMMAERDFNSKLDDIEKLVREGNAEEAMKQMQALAMEMDQFLEQLQDASDEADEQADPELAREYREFSEALDQTLEEQQALAERTKKIRDAHREQMKERIASQGAAAKRAVQQKLKELEQAYRALDTSRTSADLDQQRAAALGDIENVKQALEANDFDLAAEAAGSLSEHASALSSEGADQRRRSELYGLPPEMQRRAKQLDEELKRGEAKAEEVARALRDVFPPMGSQLSEAERQQVSEQTAQQKKLEQKVGQLKEQMKALGERAPIFDENAAEQLDQAGQHMGTAGERLAGRDPSRGYGEQQGAVQSLRGLQQQLQKQQQRSGGGKGGGLPMPMGGRGKGQGKGPSTEKVEIPDDDPNNAPRELRKDVMDAMKQGAPDRYRDQNKRYYEELVK
ncbi:MAG: DUF4175 domain-containing protein, partial [Archangium sp.]|nr:DUF4175 domain-containing protein [Archangium sp.]